MRKFVFLGAVLVGLAFLVAGVAMISLGWHTRGELVGDLLAEKLDVPDPAILLTYEGARPPEGVEVPRVTIDTAQEAHNQALVIRTHTLASTGGLTYSEMGRKDPGRELYITSLTLQNSLHLAHVGLELTLFVMGVGLGFTGLGLAVLVLGLPMIRRIELLEMLDSEL